MLWSVFIILFVSCSCDSVSCSDSAFGAVRILAPKAATFVISRDANSKRRRLDNLITALSAEIAKRLPLSMDTPPIDKPLELGYICAPPGALLGLETMKKTDKIDYSLKKDRSSNVSIKFHFDQFKLLYKRFMFRYGFTKQMEVELKPTKATLTVEVNIKRTSTILMRLLQNKCIVYITKVEFKELGDIPVEVRTPDTQKEDMLKPIVEQIFKRNYELIKDCVNEAVNVIFYNSLKSSGALLCRGKSLEDLVLDKYVLQVNPLPMSSEYNTLCA